LTAFHPHLLLAVIAGVSILLMLARPRGIAEVYWAGSGALLLLGLRLVPLTLAGKAVAEGTDVYLFLAGMMLLSELAREHGVFDWLSSVALRTAVGSRARLFTLVYAIGALVTIFMSNDATAVVLTPAILAAVRKARVPALPYLFACALIANAASFVLPISNPANLVVFRTGMPPLGRWLLSFSVPSLLSITVTYAVIRMLFRVELTGTIEQDYKPSSLGGNGRIVLAGLGLVTAILLTASALGKDLGLPTCLAALATSAAVSMKASRNPLPLLKEISWSTLALVAALFILVDAVQSIGALHVTVTALERAQHYAAGAAAGAGAGAAAGARAGAAADTGAAPAVLLTGFVVAIANNLVNNLPLGLLAGATLQATHTQGLLANAVMIGVDLGPNLSVTGSLATILWLIALRKQHVEVSFWSFLRVGAVAMPLALLASLAGAVLTELLLKTTG
jgi:arsenical pump membrane protein